MRNKLPKEPVTISLIDMDFIALELDINNCNVEVKWLRQTNSDEYRRGLKVALNIALELKKDKCSCRGVPMKALIYYCTSTPSKSYIFL